MPRALRGFFFLCTLFSVLCSLPADSRADTLRARDGREFKGIIVEDYRDRVVLSTIDGETTVMKADIEDLSYDSEEDNMIKLAEQARDARNYSRAYGLYEMAARINPNSKAAKDGLVSLEGYLYRKEEANKEDDIKRREAVEKYGNTVSAEKSEEDVFRDGVEKVRNSLGITLEIADGIPEIRSVQPGSPAANAGLRKGDRLVSVWGRLTGYMPLKDVVAVLSEKPSLEIKCGIGRTIVVDINPGIRRLSSTSGLIGAALKMEFDGLTIEDIKEGGPAMRAGIKKGDLVTALDGRSTRYMPLKNAIEYIKSTKNDFIKLTIKREILIWRNS